MNRRNFIAALGLAAILPKVATAKTPTQLNVVEARNFSIKSAVSIIVANTKPKDRLVVVATLKELNLIKKELIRSYGYKQIGKELIGKNSEFVVFVDITAPESICGYVLNNAFVFGNLETNVDVWTVNFCLRLGNNPRTFNFPKIL